MQTIVVNPIVCGVAWMIDISMLSNKQNKNQNTSWISLCGKLEAYIGNYFLSGASIPDNKIETLYYDASIDKDDSVELIDSKVNYLNPKHFSVSQLVYALNQ